MNGYYENKNKTVLIEKYDVWRMQNTILDGNEFKRTVGMEYLVDLGVFFVYFNKICKFYNFRVL